MPVGLHNFLDTLLPGIFFFDTVFWGSSYIVSPFNCLSFSRIVNVLFFFWKANTSLVLLTITPFQCTFNDISGIGRTVNFHKLYFRAQSHKKNTLINCSNFRKTAVPELNKLLFRFCYQTGIYIKFIPQTRRSKQYGSN